MGTSELPLSVTVQANAKAPPLRWEGTWGQFRDQALGSFQLAPSKLEQVLWSPTTFTAPRRRANVAESIQCLAVDVDDTSAQATRDLVQNLQAAGLEYVLYSTWKHPKTVLDGLWRYRVVVPINRPLKISEHQLWAPRVAQWLDPIVGQSLDHKCLKDIARGYFGPFVGSEDDLQRCLLLKGYGAPIDVDAFLAVPCDARLKVERPIEPHMVPREIIGNVARKWKRRSSAYINALGFALLKVFRGEPFAEPGNIDNTLWVITKQLASEIPWADPQSVADHFYQSLQVMAIDNPTYAMTTDQVRDKFERGLDLVAEKEAEKESDLDKERTARIRHAWRMVGIDRDTPYSAEELEQFHRAELCTAEEFAYRWIVRHGNSVYYFVNGEYVGPFSVRGEASNAAAQLLSPARSSGIEVHSEHEGELSLKPLGKLTDQYGQVAMTAVVSLYDQRARYDAELSEIVEAPFKLRDLEPEYSVGVADWLEELSGHSNQKHELLLRWISFLPLLHRPCAALYLYGTPNSGKSYFAEGCSRLWNKRSFTPLGEAMGNFNDSVLKNPLLFGDESMPTDFRGKGRTAELREWIQRRTTPLKRKFLPTAEIRGSFRFVLAANNENLLSTHEELSPDDISAITERIIMLHIPPGAAQCLKHYIHTFDEDTVARHFKWVQAKMEYVPKGRFCLVDPDQTVHKGMSTRSGTRYMVCEFFVRYLQKSAAIDQFGKQLILVKDGNLYAMREAFTEFWTPLMGDHQRQPGGDKLGKALKSLSTGRIKLNERWYRALDIQHLMAWAHDNDAGDRQDIRDALLVDTAAKQGAHLRAIK